MEKQNYISQLEVRTGVEVDRCYQCGKCSAGCVLAPDMNFPPSYLMRLLQTSSKENFEKILRSNTIWLCVNCENCVGRCPMEIDIPKIMDYLREQSLEENKVNPESKPIVSFHRSFLDSVKYTGRIYEVGLVAAFKARTFRFTQDLALAPLLFMKGRLPIFPEKIAGRKGIRKLFNQTIDNTKS